MGSLESPGVFQFLLFLGFPAQWPASKKQLCIRHKAVWINHYSLPFPPLGAGPLAQAQAQSLNFKGLQIT